MMVRKQHVFDFNYLKNSEHVEKATYLAIYVSAKSRKEIADISQSNPELIKEWLDELKEEEAEANFVRTTMSQTIEHVLTAARLFSKLAAE